MLFCQISFMARICRAGINWLARSYLLLAVSRTSGNNSQRLVTEVWSKKTSTVESVVWWYIFSSERWRLFELLWDLLRTRVITLPGYRYGMATPIWRIIATTGCWCPIWIQRLIALLRQQISRHNWDHQWEDGPICGAKRWPHVTLEATHTWPNLCLHQICLRWIAHTKYMQTALIMSINNQR